MKRIIFSTILLGAIHLTYAQTPVLIKQNVDGRRLFSFDGKAYFNEFNTTHPWMSDGTTAGTVPLSTTLIYTGDFRKAGNYVFFTAADSVGKVPDLCKTDGTAAGTGIILNINPTGISFTTLGIEYNNKLYFSADDGAVGNALWSSDGTVAGTTISNSVPNTFKTFVDGYQIINNKLVYLCNPPSGGGYTIRSFDGVTDNVITLAPYMTSYMAPLNLPLFPHRLEVAGNIFYGFSTGGIQLDLLKTNGTTYTQQGFSGNMNGIVNTSTAIYFSDFAVATGHELYKADLNFNNITLVKDANPSNIASGTVFKQTVFKDTLIYFYNDGVNGFELWKSDGSAAGTNLLKDILPGSSASMSGYFANGPGMIEFCGKLYFTATDSVHGAELWVTDGTEIGTKMVADINSGTASSEISELMISNGRMYFFAYDGVDWSLWMIEECYTPTAIPAPLSEKVGFTVYPNPSSGTFSIEIPNVKSSYSLDICNSMGAVITTQHQLQESNNIDLKNYSNGFYIINLKNGTQIVGSQKLIKQ